MKKYLFIASLLISITSQAQMVNIEGQRMHTDSIRVAGNVNLGLMYSETNDVRLLLFKVSEAFQLKSKDLRHLWLLLGNYEISRSGEQEFANAWFAHARYNYKINNWLRWEVYAQGQFNKLLGIQFRYLNGTGPRFKLFGTNDHTGYAGTSYMYEYEETSEEPRSFHRQHRISNYLTFTFHFKKLHTEIVSTTYFQPRIAMLNDHRIMHQTALNLLITNKLKFTTGFLYLYDSEPPVGFNGRSLKVEQGIRYDF